MKRVMDFAGALAALVLLSPIILLLGLVVRSKLGSPVFFRQVRPGIKGRPFDMVKFRTMTDERGPDGTLLPDDQRLTGLGTWLRLTSLDELPELFNVLRGDMSLVGPRPLLMEYLPLYNDRQARRHEVRPGITGWAQINGRNNIDWQEKFDLDVWYVDHASFWLDLKILFLTAWKVIKRSGVSKDGHATTDYFRGNSYDD